MDYHLFRYAVLLLIGILFYAVLARGLFNATGVYRRKALVIAENLFQSDQVADDKKRFMYARLGEVHSTWQAWCLLALLLQAFVKIPFVDMREITTRVDDGIPVSRLPEYSHFITCWMVATLGNSPLATFLFATLALVLIAFFSSLSLISTILAGASVGRGHGKAISRAHG